MRKKYPNQYKKKNKSTILWMMIIGAGLILISLALLFSNLKNPISPDFQTSNSQYSTIPIVVNYDAPDIELSDIDSKEVSLLDYRDNIVLVNNWATWCPPCKAEMPTLQTYYENHKEEGLIIVAIESGEKLEEVREFVSLLGITFPVWIDENAEALNAFKNWDLPSSYVIDRSGTVRLTWTGEISLEMLEKYVTPIVNE